MKTVIDLSQPPSRQEQLVPLTEEEQEQRALDEQSSLETQVDMRRVERNALLAASDWTMLPDAPVINVEDWAYYRQQLRDHPLDDSSFPDKPE